MRWWGWGVEVTQLKGNTTQAQTYQLSGEGQTAWFWPSSQLAAALKERVAVKHRHFEGAARGTSKEGGTW